ncbi:MAG: ABC transporter substrate-binding protein [Deltaproteobacteria bacterium]|nr:ABC transporter substrate-binding protein [Deltaproteobacteria bacterium]
MKRINYIKSCSLGLSIYVFLAIFIKIAWASPAVRGCPEPGPPIKLGFIASTSAPFAPFYKAQETALMIGIDEINKRGGVCGKRKLKLYTRDYDYKPAVSAIIAEELITNEKVDFLIGPMHAVSAQQVTKIAKKYNKVCLFPASHAAKLTIKMAHPFMLQIPPSTYMKGKAVGMYLSDQPYKKYISLGSKSILDIEEAKSWKEYMAKKVKEFRLTKSVTVEPMTKDFSAQVLEILDARPDAVFCTLRWRSLVEFMSQAKEMGFFKKTAFVGSFDLNVLQAMKDQMPSGLIGYSEAPFYAIDTPEMRSFSHAFMQRTGSWPPEVAIMAYDSLLVLVKAIEQAGDIDSLSVAKVLRTLTFRGLQGKKSINPKYNMVNSGLYVGKTFKDPKYPFSILSQVKYFPAEKLWESLN